MGRKPRFRLGYGAKLFWSHLIAVFLVSGSVGTYFYTSAMDSLMRSLRSRLQNSAALLSQSIDAHELDAVTAPDDVAEPAYLRSLEKLRRMRRTNPDIAFLYVMRKEGDRVLFVVDSDETERQALPGREYPEVPSRMLEGFADAAVDDELFTDEWGVFLSGYAPLRNGEGRYLVGIDMRADEVAAKLKQLRLTGMISLLASMLLALLFALLLSRGLSRRIGILVGPCRSITAGRFDARIQMRTFDEFDDLIEAFNIMGEELGQARSRADQALAELRQAHGELEARVAERTAELQSALDKVNVLTGLLPMCAWCKKIRDDQGYWQEVESFVSAHSGARFSHGLCPACKAQMDAEILRAKPT